MIKIEKKDDLKVVQNKHLHNYIKNLLEYLFKTYEVTDISEFGAIFVLECKTDLLRYEDLYLSSPLNDCLFEWVEDIGNGFINCCIVIDNDRAVNIITERKLISNLIESEDIR